MYIFGYKTTVFIQNLYILVKFFGKNFIFSVKSTNFLVFQDQMLVKFFGKNFIFSVKSTFFLFFQNQMYIFGYKTTPFLQNLYLLVIFFSKNFIFSVKSTNFLVFQDQMLVKFFGIW